MIAAFVISSIILLIGILLMGYNIFFTKNGKFPNIHIGGNPGLKKQGIACATTQDREARKITRKNLANEMVNEMINKF